jgi:class 3 adenylate cyclase/predicted ATPase
MQCPRCQQEAPLDSEYCPECGTKLALTCSQCGTVNAPGHKFCKKCGQPLSAQRPSVQTDPRSDSSARSPKEAERRQLTVMFCDLVGSTALSERLDPEDLRDVLRAYQDTCAEALRRFEGHIAQTLGDGLMVYFGYPRAHEDDVHRAARAGLEILHGIAGLDRRLRAERGVAVAVRIGIHTGLVVAGEVGGADTRSDMAVIGETPNVAARLQALATPNTVVVSEATWRLLGGAFEAEDLGGHPLKGLSAPQRLFRILREHPAEGRFEAMHRFRLTPLVGRDEEIGLLLSRWALARNGAGQVVVLGGDPGIGKSRITRTARERIAGDQYVGLQYQCSPFFRNTAFYPVIGQLQFAAGFVPDDGADAKLGKLETLLARSGGAVQDAAPLLAALLSVPTDGRYPPLALSPQRQKERTMEVLVEQLRRLAAAEPVLAIFEDVHWIDPTTLEYLEHLASELANIAVLMVITHRPEFDPPWGRHAHVTLHSLNRLSRHQCAVMVGCVVGKPLPEALVGQIVDRTDGVPLFVEELTKAVVESSLVVDAGDRYELSGIADSLRIPATLHDSLLARLDRLIPVKEVAQLGAAIGREFSHELLVEVSPMGEAELDAALDRLLRSELMYRRGVPPQATYIFKHALVQEAAYQSLLKSTRQQHHQRIATVLMQRFPHVAETQPELVAHHCTEAGLHAEAVGYWQRAGRRATERSALAEAVSHYTKALTVLEQLPDTDARVEQELLLQTDLGWTIMAGKGWTAPEAERAFTRALELGERTNATRELLPALYGLSVFFKMGASYDKAEAVARQALTIAERIDEHDAVVSSRYQIGSISFRRGNPLSAQLNLEAALNTYRPGERDDLATYLFGGDPKTAALADLSTVLWLLGYPDTAVRRSEETLAHARALQKPFALCYALNAEARLRLLLRDWPAARQAAETELAIAEEQGFRYWAAGAKGYRGLALAHQGEIAEGIRMVNTCVEEIGGPAASVTLWLVFLSGVHVSSANAEGAMDSLADAARQIERTDERTYEAELHRLEGELTLLRDAEALDKAEEFFMRALESARRQQAKSLELRAAMSLSRLWQRQDKHTAARQTLAEVYGWFTEGFDTPDLQEAKALLDDLSA